MSSVSSTSRPSSPTKSGAAVSDVLKPNPHPYAIKTTSTGILSRSSSSSSSAHSHNHYVPVSPSPSPTKQRYTEYSEGRYRHRYSRSITDENNPRPMPVPSEDSSYQRSRTGSFSESFDESIDPKLWTYEQLAENVPEIANFVREHEITGRGFLRFDDGVLDAYGITQHWQRSLILNHSLRLKRLQNRSLNTFCGSDAGRLSNSFSHYTGEHQYSLEEDDPAYLSSSSSASSTGERTKRRSRPNGRVHGMVASYERSTSPEKAQSMRDRSDGASSIHDEHRLFRPQYNGSNYGRPLPFPPQPTVEHKAGPLLLPQTSFPNSFPSSLNRPHSTGNSSQATPHATGNGVITDHTIQHTATHSRPLPATPLHPSLCSSPVLNEDFADNLAIATRSTSEEMTIDELITVLDPGTELLQPHAFVNIDRRKARKVSDKKGGAAWEMDIGETVKHVLPNPPSTIAKAHPVTGDDELTVEELLALKGEIGATAWMDEPEGIVRTMKHVDSEGKENKNTDFGNISKGRSFGKGGVGRKSRGYGKKQVRHVGEIFLPERGTEEGSEKPWKMEQIEAEALELECMREVEKRPLHTEEEQRWEHRAAEMAESHNGEDAYTKDSELRNQDEKSRKEEERKLSQKQRRMEEETQHEDHEQRVKGLAAAERQRQEAMEQLLASSIAENRRLLEEFRIRLERVEQCVEAFETVPDSPSLGNPNTCVLQRLRTIAVWALPTHLCTALPATLGVFLADFIRGSKTSMARLEGEAIKNTDNRRDKSRTVVSLYSKIFPRYAILFGLGICAFMLKGFRRWGFKGMRVIGAVGARGVRGR